MFNEIKNCVKEMAKSYKRYCSAQECLTEAHIKMEERRRETSNK